MAYQSALNTLSCFVTPQCFPRHNCQYGGIPKKIKRGKYWEEMAFCTDDLTQTTKQRREGKKNNGCLVYSFGIHTSTEWETKVAKLFGCEVHAFDPTVSHNNTAQMTFHQWGLQGEGTDMSATHADEYAAVDPRRLFTLSQIMKRLGHQGRTVDVLMLDCEGCEWGVLKQLVCNNNNDDGASHAVHQLIVETHYQRAMGLADEQDVLLAAEAITCLRRDGWGMVTQEASGCAHADANYTRGVAEVLPHLWFLMYSTFRRVPPGSVPSLSDLYDPDKAANFSQLNYSDMDKVNQAVQNLYQRHNLPRNKGIKAFDKYDQLEEPASLS